MHVIHITPAYPTIARPSEAVFIEQQVQALCEAGIQVTVIVCKPLLPNLVARRLQHYKYLADIEQNEQYGNPTVRYSRYLHIPRYYWPNATVKSCANSVIKILNLLNTKGVDLIHAHDFYPIGMATRILKGKLHLPGLLQLHVNSSHLLANHALRNLTKETLENFELLTAVGSPIKRTLNKAFGSVVDKINIVRHGVCIPEYISIKNITHDSRLQLFTVCSLQPIKGVDFTLSALAKLKKEGLQNWTLTIIGDGWQRSELEKMAAELELNDCVSFLGRLPHDEAMAKLSHADLFVMPSWDEAFGLVYVEAMAMGIPAIGCLGQGAQDIITHNFDGLLVEPKSLESLTNALQLALKNPGRLLELGEQARITGQKYNWRANSEVYIKLYESVLGRYTQ